MQIQHLGAVLPLEGPTQGFAGGLGQVEEDDAAIGGRSRIGATQVSEPFSEGWGHSQKPARANPAADSSTAPRRLSRRPEPEAGPVSREAAPRYGVQHRVISAARAAYDACQCSLPPQSPPLED